MDSAASRAAGMQVEKVKLHSLGRYHNYYPPGRGVPSSTLRPREGGGNEQQRSRSRVSSVSFKRTSTLSDGTPEIEAGAAEGCMLRRGQIEGLPSLLCLTHIGTLGSCGWDHPRRSAIEGDARSPSRRGVATAASRPAGWLCDLLPAWFAGRGQVGTVTPVCKRALEERPAVLLSLVILQGPASAPSRSDRRTNGETWEEGRERDEEWIPCDDPGMADQMHTGPSQTGEVAGEEITFVGMNKAIENRVCINLRRMSWAEAPRKVFLVERSDGWRTVGSEGRRLDHKCYLAVESICRHCKEGLGLDILVEGRYVCVCGMGGVAFQIFSSSPAPPYSHHRTLCCPSPLSACLFVSFPPCLAFLSFLSFSPRHSFWWGVERRIKRELPHLTFLQSCDGYDEDEDEADEATGGGRGSKAGAAEAGQGPQVFPALPPSLLPRSPLCLPDCADPDASRLTGSHTRCTRIAAPRQRRRSGARTHTASHGTKGAQQAATRTGARRLRRCHRE